MGNPSQKDRLRVSEAVKEYPIQASTLRKWIFSRAIDSYRIGRAVFVLRRDIERMIRVTKALR